ncbi:hypothetical protein LLG10_00655 [bacterium]|nr:hypothetical protein [bacterium]
MTHSEKQRVTIFLNPELIKQAKAQAIVEDKTLAALIENALINYLPLETLIKKKIFLMSLISSITECHMKIASEESQL